MACLAASLISSSLTGMRFWSATCEITEPSAA